MLVSVHQPNFLPWAGYWNKIIHSDAHLILINVKPDYEHGNRVMVNKSWMTLPVLRDTKDNYFEGVLLQDYKINRTKIIRTIEQNFYTKRNPFKNRLDPILEELNKTHFRLGALNLLLFGHVARILGIDIGKVHMPGCTLSGEGSKSERLRKYIVDNVGPNFIYLSGMGAIDYMDEEEFVYPVKYQRVLNGEVPTGTVLEIIVKHEDPYNYIKNSFDFVDKEVVCQS